jgi:hypothetical protein
MTLDYARPAVAKHAKSSWIQVIVGFGLAGRDAEAEERSSEIVAAGVYCRKTPEDLLMPTARTTKTSTSEVAIFSRIFADARQSLTPELARHILALEFSDEDKTRMHDLAAKNREGVISAEELRDLDSYIKVADLVAILQSRARKFLRTKTR